MNKNDLKLYLVTDNSDDEKKFLNTIEEAIKGGVSLVQIREKTKDTIEFYNLALKVKKITKKYNIPLIINDRIDVALILLFMIQCTTLPNKWHMKLQKVQLQKDTT